MGQDPAVVCLHAIGHGGGDFADFASAVKDRFEVIRIDWPGQGQSGPDPKPLSPARYYSAWRRSRPVEDREPHWSYALQVSQ